MAAIRTKILWKDRAFRAALHALGVAGFGWLQGIALLNQLREKRSFPDINRKRAAKRNFEEIGAGQPLFDRISALSATLAPDIKLEQVFLSSKATGFGLKGYYSGKRLALYVSGDPLGTPEGEDILKGALGTQLARVGHQDAYYRYWDSSFWFQASTMHPFLVYGALLVSGFAWPLATGLTVGAVSAGAAAIRLVYSGYRRNHDLLADIDGARLTGDPQATLAALRQMTGFKPDQPKTGFLKAIFTRHATLSRRMENLSHAFGLTTQTPPDAAMPPPPAPAL